MIEISDAGDRKTALLYTDEPEVFRELRRLRRADATYHDRNGRVEGWHWRMKKREAQLLVKQLTEQRDLKKEAVEM